MQTTLYCSQTHLRLVCGKANGNKVKIKTATEIPLPEGGISNGVIVDKNIMIGYFTDIINRYELDRNKTTFIIDNNHIRVKNINVPSLKHTEIMKMITTDFIRSYMYPTGEIVDYAVTDKTRGKDGYSVLATAVEKSIIESYLDVLLGAGMNLKHFTIGANCRMKAERLNAENDILFDGNLDTAKYLLNIGALITPGVKQRDIELLNSFEEFHSKSRRRSKFTLKTVSISVAALIVVSFGTFYMIQTAQLQDDKTALAAYLNDATVKADYEAANDAMAQIEHAEKTTAQLETATKSLESYPNLTSEQLRQIAAIGKTQKTRITSIDFNKNTGRFTIACISESATYIPAFISNLRECGLFADVTYDGYTSSAEETKVNKDKSENKEGAEGSVLKYEFTAKATVNSPKDITDDSVAAKRGNDNA
jgi:Tfp pilus assembly protein PilN